MVLRKRAPPHLYSLSQGNARFAPRSTAAQTSPTAKSTASLSPKRLTRPRRAQSSPQPRRLSSQESIYSPDLNTSPAFDLMPLEQAQKSPVRSSGGDAPNPWADELVERPDQNRQEYTSSELPQLGHGSQEGGTVNDRGPDRVPSVLVAGTERRTAANDWQQSQGLNDTSDWEHLGGPSTPLRSNNPFLKPRQPDQNPWDDRNSRPHSEDTASLSQDGASARLGQDEGYIPMTARLSLFDQPVSESPWAEEHSNAALPPTAVHQNQHSAPIQQNYTGQYTNQAAPTQFQQPYTPSNDPQSSYPPQPFQQQQQQQQQQYGLLAPENGINTPATVSTATSGSSHVLIDFDENPQPHAGTSPSKTAHEHAMNNVQEPQPSAFEASGSAPPLPDRSNVAGAVSQPTESEPNRQQEQKLETYAIRHVNWTDITGKLRDSPILSQNKNGPCPLLALVNALVLRANPDTQPPIVRALQTREQISLGLLIEALFDELTTCLGPDDELPDIEALSRFLTMLHTGMNVNPRLTLESQHSVGTFMRTDDIKLYSTFGVPLLHGWIAAPSSDVDGALARVAPYHEDVQLLHFRKQEFEDRVLRGGSLSPQEEQEMKDIQAIQQFTDIDNATQLSSFGLMHLAEKLPPGSLSILFRNDHFTTLYKHPKSQQLYTLVTDAGYSNYAEIVWESLVDVNGSSAGFFAGDFRPVGHTSSPGASDPSGPRTSSNTRAPSAPSEHANTTLSAQEQADADYAYALSLQYQEEERRESSGNNRDRNQRSSGSTPALSHSQRSSANNRSSGFTPDTPYTSYSGTRSSHQSLPPRRTSQYRPESRRATNDEGDDAPPPTYEQSAHSPIYTGPSRGPNAPETPSSHQYPRSPLGRRHPGGSISAGPSDRIRERNKDCVIM
ncbi:hypothetical protein P170DRAFT_377731 [Aspergillus steynii IBT 23096]|uniref:MINDY deubiquitinase domain-containing protein n=1 Tax=Aspergillus steynii IBT 23096 TaxID=1392250 RepID=A0A2I2GH17_9EURO|nr:uncharacterized protein P170DRAFT_377731 [Aspergillus steynii IBT 23096]PLB52170.1 hypothetical protein P170DRAFT_377731 [Aspergillus steynii IBT 23096]